MGCLPWWWTACRCNLVPLLCAAYCRRGVPVVAVSNMARYVHVLREIGVTDTNAVETLGPLIEQFYTASARLHRALLPHGGTAHAAVSRAASPSHDPDAEQVRWANIFDKLGLFSMRDSYTSRMIDALFRYIWRFHEADGFVAQLASRRAPEAVPVVGAPNVAAGGAQGQPLRALLAPHNSAWVYGPRPDVVVPSASVLVAARRLITVLDETPNAAAAARKIAACSLLALYKHVFSTVYKAVDAASPDGDESAVAGGDDAMASDQTARARDTMVVDSEQQVALPSGQQEPRTSVALGVDEGNGGGREGSDGPIADAALGSSSATEIAAQLFMRAQTPSRIDTTPPPNTSRTSSQASPVTASSPSGPPPHSSGSLDTPSGVSPGDLSSAPPGAPQQVSPGAGQVLPPPAPLAPPDRAQDTVPAAVNAPPPAGAQAEHSGDTSGNTSAAMPRSEPPGAHPSAEERGNSVVSPSTRPGRLNAAARSRRSGGSAKENIKMEQLMSHFKCTWWGSFKSTSGRKEPAPEGTLANPDGEASVMCFRSAWVQRVHIAPLKDDLMATSYGNSSLYKWSQMGDEVAVCNLANIHRKAMHSTLGLILLVCAREPLFTDILMDMLSSPIAGIIPTGRSAIVGGIVQVGRRQATSAGPAGTNSSGVEGDRLPPSVGGARSPSPEAAPTPEGRTGGDASAGGPTGAERPVSGATREGDGVAVDQTSEAAEAEAVSGAASADRPTGAGHPDDMPGARKDDNPLTAELVSGPTEAPAGAGPPSGARPGGAQGAGARRGAPGAVRAGGQWTEPDFMASQSPVADAVYYFNSIPSATLARRSRIAKRRASRTAGRGGRRRVTPSGLPTGARVGSRPSADQSPSADATALAHADDNTGQRSHATRSSSAAGVDNSGLNAMSPSPETNLGGTPRS